MRRTILIAWALTTLLTAKAEDGSRLWLRYDSVNTARVSGVTNTLAADELRTFYRGAKVHLTIDPTMTNPEAYRISGDTLAAATERGLLYGAYALLRGERTSSAPAFRLIR